VPPSATTIPVFSPIATGCAWTQVYHIDVPSEIREQAQQQFGATGLEGSLQVSGYGELNSCDQQFHLAAVDFEFTLPVADLHDQQTMAARAAQVVPIPQQVVEGKPIVASGKVTVRYSVVLYPRWESRTNPKATRKPFMACEWPCP